MTMSVLFTPSMMPRVFAEWLRIKYGRMASALGGGKSANGVPAAGRAPHAVSASPANDGGNGAGAAAPPEPMGFSEPIHVPLASIRARAQAARAARPADASETPR
jgi:hypothetical protein